jgi:hypothetical protein
MSERGDKMKRAKALEEKAKLDKKNGVSSGSDIDDTEITELDNALEEHINFRKKAEEALEEENRNQAGDESEATGNMASESDMNAINMSNQEDVIPETVSLPLDDSVKKRSYTGGDINGTATAPNQQEPFIPEPVYKTPPIDSPKVEGEQKDGESGTGKEPKVDKPKVNPDYDDMSPSQKRKHAEQTADVALATWATILPILPKKIAKFNLDKLERMDRAGEIRLNQAIDENGTTFREYVEQRNEQVDKVFTYTEDMKQAIKAPLVEVIMEKGITPTPLQQLGIAVVGQLIQFGAATMEMRLENNAHLKQMVEFMQGQKTPPPPPVEPEVRKPNPNPAPPPPPPVQEYRQPEQKREEQNITYTTNNQNSQGVQTMQMDDVLDATSDLISIEEVIPESENENQ